MTVSVSGRVVSSKEYLAVWCWGYGSRCAVSSAVRWMMSEIENLSLLTRISFSVRCRSVATVADLQIFGPSEWSMILSILCVCQKPAACASSSLCTFVNGR